MMRLKMTAESLRSLARSVACWHYVTPVEDLDVMKKLHHEGVAGEMGEIAMDLFYQLQEPDTDKDGVSTEEKYRRAANSFRSIFGLEEIKEPVAMLSPTGETVVIRPEGYEEGRGLPMMKRVRIRIRMTGIPKLRKRIGRHGSGLASSCGIS